MCQYGAEGKGSNPHEYGNGWRDGTTLEGYGCGFSSNNGHGQGEGYGMSHYHDLDISNGDGASTESGCGMPTKVPWTP